MSDPKATNPESSPEAGDEAAVRHEADISRLDERLRLAIADAATELNISEENIIRRSVLLLARALRDRTAAPRVAVLVVEGDVRLVDDPSDASDGQINLAILGHLRPYDSAFEALVLEGYEEDEAELTELLLEIIAARGGR